MMCVCVWGGGGDRGLLVDKCDFSVGMIYTSMSLD